MSQYPLFKECYEMIEQINAEKAIGLATYEILVHATNFYANLLGEMKRADAQAYPEFALEFDS